jgi:DNA modification methylase
VSDKDATMGELVRKWGVAHGQIWEISGRLSHYAHCGDARDEGAKYIFQEVPVGLFTSPPYLAQRKYGKDVGCAALESQWADLVGTVMRSTLARFSDNRAQVFVNLGLVHNEGRVVRYWESWLDYMEQYLSWPLLAWNVWDKLHAIPGNHYGRFAPRHEWLFHFARKGILPAKA